MPLEYTSLPVGHEIYIQLTWLFTVVITVLMLLICYLYLSMRKALERESFSLTFSNLMIEGIETERRRISRELHDIVLPQIRDRVVADQIRTICMDLMPPDFSKLSLKDSLADVCQQFITRSGISCACFIEEELNFTPLSRENQLHLYRMVQEAFTNIEKHSRAQKASLVVRSNARSSPENILICVSDDGVGLSGEVDAGLGIGNMRQRAAILGARLDFSSESGNGLMVRIEINTGN
jgi:two-component system NarL family sensor kinase